MDVVATVTIPGVFEDLTVLGNIGGKQSVYRQRLVDGGAGNGAEVLDGPIYQLSEPGTIHLRDDVFANGRLEKSLAFSNDQDCRDGKRGLPVFFETRYIFRAKCSDKVKDVRIYHRLKQVTEGFTFAGGWLFGDVDFVNTPGRFTLALDVSFTDGSSRRIKFQFMVVSVKMDVEGDYRKILKKIELERPGLVQNFLAKTFGDSGFSAQGDPSRPVWYSILETIYDFYVGAVRQIINNPHRRYERVSEWRRPDQIKRWTPALANRYLATPKDRRESAWLRVERVEAETDTQENRFVLHTLRQIAHQLTEFAAEYRQVKAISRECLSGVVAQARTLEELAGHPFFRGVGRYTGGAAQSLVLQKRPGYMQVLSAWVALKQALTPEGRGVDVGYRPLSALYEFWTFLTTRELLDELLVKAAGYERFDDPPIADLAHLLDSDDETPAGGDKTLCRMGYKYVRGSRAVLLAYQQTYGTGADEDTFAITYDQRPDIVMSIQDGTNTYTYLFDAKYRVDELGGKDASPRDAIDDMHRYRDAILYRRQQAGLSREVIGAYVLYPGRPYGHSFDYTQMMATENIGAFPLLPDKTSVLKDFLAETLAKIDPSAHLGKATSVRGTTVVVGEAYGEVNIFDFNVANNEWDKWFSSTRVIAEIASQDLSLAGKDPAAIKCIRLHNPNKPIATLEVTLHSSPPDGVGTYSYNILRQSVAER